ncbi:unnamed protein product [Mytilus edulis]|uniref:B box-type domain-containing protein n=1 Tax=Mytilus edulis TaxID=6550 RepID=A0A8S3TBW9_MYTED|nr:unnamed protein product [Mytilus edulis]
MATNTSICGICSLRQITQTSNHWCPQCEEALCDECRDHHKLLKKVTRSHVPILISDYNSIPPFITDIEESCVYHNEQYQQNSAEKAEINERLDNLEKQIIKDLEQKECESKESIQKVLSSVKEKETMVIKCQTDFQSIKQYASDLQTFLGINETEVQIYEKEQYLQSLKKGKSLEHLDLVWKVHPVVQSISSSLQNFGSTEIKIRSSHIEFTRAKDKQAQLQVLTTKENIDDVKLKRITEKASNKAAADNFTKAKTMSYYFQAGAYKDASEKKSSYKPQTWSWKPKESEFKPPQSDWKPILEPSVKETETWKVLNAGYKLPRSE